MVISEIPIKNEETVSQALIELNDETVEMLIIHEIEDFRLKT
jgi:hypothetical protein